MSNTKDVPRPRSPRNNSLEGFVIPDQHRLDEATPAGLLLHAMTTDDGDVFEEMLSATRDELSAFTALACASGDAPHGMATLFSSFERKLRVLQEMRRRELAGRAAR